MHDKDSSKLEAISSYAMFCNGGASPAYPLEIFLEVSNLCNLKCAMCWQFSALNTNRLKQLKSQDRGFIDVTGFDDNLSAMLDGALLVHCFGFGEPTLHPQFRSILEQINTHGAMCDFYTNGMNLDQDLCDLIVDMKLMQIIVSFSGTTKDFYENVYIGGEFNRVLGGIARLAETKRSKRSFYPIIHINSIGFNDHVASFDDFTSMMGRHGANSVILNHLSVHSDVPYLHEHVSYMRPDEEGAVLARAREIGATLGIAVNTEAYERHAVAGEASYQARQSELRGPVAARLQAQGRAFGDNPVRVFREIARGLPVIREERRDNRTRSASLASDADPETVRRGLKIESRAGGMFDDGAFACMEPFKTFYATRNGAVKPCCLANTDLFLGDVGQDDARAIWNGAGYDEVRSGISRGDYPNFCVDCRKNKTAPAYSANSMVDRYMDWNEAAFGPGLRAALSRHNPRAMALIRNSSPSAMMALARRRTASGDACDHGMSAPPPPSSPAMGVMTLVLDGEVADGRAWLAHIERCSLRSEQFLTVEGWALDPSGAYADSIELILDGTPCGQAPTIVRRKDVAAVHPDAAGAECGFTFLIGFDDELPERIELRLSGPTERRTIGGAVTWTSSMTAAAYVQGRFAS